MWLCPLRRSNNSESSSTEPWMLEMLSLKSKRLKSTQSWTTSKICRSSSNATALTLCLSQDSDSSSRRECRLAPKIASAISPTSQTCPLLCASWLTTTLEAWVGFELTREIGLSATQAERAPNVKLNSTSTTTTTCEVSHAKVNTRSWHRCESSVSTLSVPQRQASSQLLRPTQSSKSPILSKSKVKAKFLSEMSSLCSIVLQSLEVKCIVSRMRQPCFVVGETLCLKLTLMS